MKYTVETVGAFEVNCTVLTDGATRAALVDPGEDARSLLKYLADHQLTLEMILLTHGHADHICALDELLAQHPVPVVFAEADAAWAFTPLNRFAPYVTIQHRPAKLIDACDKAVFDCCGAQCQVIATPGHTPGGVCYYFEQEKLLIAGDTLFAGSVGRTDLPGGDWDTLAASLKKLTALPDDVTVIPGHGGLTTIRQEKQSNPYLR